MKFAGREIRGSDQQLFLLGLDSLKLFGTVVASRRFKQPWRLDGTQCKQNKAYQGNAKKALR